MKAHSKMCAFYISTTSLIPYQNPWLLPPLTPYFPSVIVLNVRRAVKEKPETR